MPSTCNHIASVNTRTAKRSRIAKKAAGCTIVVKGCLADKSPKAFHFSILMPAQQMKERNKAYRFFSID